MDLIKCPVCGEKYSSSYRRCPFCEEEDRPRKVSGKRRGGHHVAERKHTHSARGPLIAVLLVVLLFKLILGDFGPAGSLFLVSLRRQIHGKNSGGPRERCGDRRPRAGRPDARRSHAG